MTLLRDDLQTMQRPGTTGRSEELRQQVVALQVGGWAGEACLRARPRARATRDALVQVPSSHELCLGREQGWPVATAIAALTVAPTAVAVACALPAVPSSILPRPPQEENRELRSELGSSQQQSQMGRLSLGSGGSVAASSRRGSNSSATGAPPAGSRAGSQAGSMAGSRRQTGASRVQSGRQQVARGGSLLQRVSTRDDAQLEALPSQGALAHGEADLVDELGFGSEPEPEEGVGYFDEQQEDEGGEQYEMGAGADDDYGGQHEMTGRQSGEEQAW